MKKAPEKAHKRRPGVRRVIYKKVFVLWNVKFLKQKDLKELKENSYLLAHRMVSPDAGIFYWFWSGRRQNC
jgi:hypothetical protein